MHFSGSTINCKNVVKLESVNLSQCLSDTDVDTICVTLYSNRVISIPAWQRITNTATTEKKVHAIIQIISKDNRKCAVFLDAIPDLEAVNTKLVEDLEKYKRSHERSINHHSSGSEIDELTQNPEQRFYRATCTKRRITMAVAVTVTIMLLVVGVCMYNAFGTKEVLPAYRNSSDSENITSVLPPETNSSISQTRMTVNDGTPTMPLTPADKGRNIPQPSTRPDTKRNEKLISNVEILMDSPGFKFIPACSTLQNGKLEICTINKFDWTSEIVPCAEYFTQLELSGQFSSSDLHSLIKQLPNLQSSNFSNVHLVSDSDYYDDDQDVSPKIAYQPKHLETAISLPHLQTLIISHMSEEREFYQFVSQNLLFTNISILSISHSFISISNMEFIHQIILDSGNLSILHMHNIILCSHCNLFSHMKNELTNLKEIKLEFHRPDSIQNNRAWRNLLNSSLIHNLESLDSNVHLQSLDFELVMKLKQLKSIGLYAVIRADRMKFNVKFTTYFETIINWKINIVPIGNKSPQSSNRISVMGLRWLKPSIKDFTISSNFTLVPTQSMCKGNFTLNNTSVLKTMKCINS